MVVEPQRGPGRPDRTGRARATTGYEPGRPILVAMHIRNRLGVARSSPTEFVRPGSDGKPALRKGVDLSLWHSPSRGPRSIFNQVYPNEVIEPKRDAHFDPGERSRLLAPLEAFEAMRLDLNDWFDLTKPGKYPFAGDLRRRLRHRRGFVERGLFPGRRRRMSCE